MNIQQCRYLVAVSTHRCNLTDAAKSLFTSQPGISKQLKLLEDEVGAQLLVRRRNRVVGFTDAGNSAVNIAKRLLRDVEHLKSLGQEGGEVTGGALSIAATHVQARYALLPLIKKFKARYPQVDIRLMQCNPDQVAGLVSSGAADVGLSISSTAGAAELVRLPCYKIQRSVITPKSHPLTKLARLRLVDLVKYPMIILDSSFSAGVSVLNSFQEAGLAAKVVMNATDADIIKAYVEAGIGVATMPSIAYDAKTDLGLASISAKHLFRPSVISIWLHRDAHLPAYMSSFIELVCPRWNAGSIEHALNEGPAEDDDELPDIDLDSLV